MRRQLRLFLPLVALLGLLVSPEGVRADHGSADEASPNMFHLANLPPPPEFVNCNKGSSACFNSDLAFWDAGGLKGGYTDILAQGNYEGFRLIDVSDPENPTEISVVECRTNQGDVSFYQAKDRLLLIQSIEEQVSSPDCATATEMPVVAGTNPVTNIASTFRQKGHEGLRIFDVTNPEAPQFLTIVRTACGSHTHTTIRDDENQRAIVYVSSYPSGVRVTRKEDLETLPEQPNCLPDHNKISIVEIPDENPAAAHVLKEQPLDADTATWSGTGNGNSPVRGCHDITVFEFSDSRKVAGAACLSEGQLWDVSDPANPTTAVPGQHSHIENLIIDNHVPPVEGLFHTASFSWDGEVVLFTDEWQGGGAHGCDGPGDHRGNVWFYGNTPPGSVPPLFGRYILPRTQPQNEICTMHNGNVIPTNDGYFGVSSAYQAGTSVYDFTGVTELDPVEDTPEPGDTIPTAATEVAFFDAKNDPAGPTGIDDAWSTYWHNDYLFTSSGLTSGSRPGARGLDVYLLLGRQGRLVDDEGNPAVTAANVNHPSVQQYLARKFRYQNPQTQEVNENLGR
ncbi:MAG TPA: hypothetical protein VG602_09790 [Actinomycetota bacterium]|nr:hypothetical protein [Actinomycetota bacterium]